MRRSQSTETKTHHAQSHALYIYHQHHHNPKEVSLLNQEEDENRGYEFDMSGRDGIYYLEWPALHISAKVDRFKQNSDQEVKADMYFKSERPTSAGDLDGGRIILGSISSKKTLATYLKERDLEVDWGKVVSQAATATLNDYRAGHKETQIGDVDVQNHIKWDVSPLLQQGNPTLVYGQGSVGKSWIGIWLAVLLDSGQSSCGLNVEPQPGGVLILDWETELSEIGSRVNMVRRGMGLEGPSPIWVKSMTQGLRADLEAVRNIVVDKGIRTVVLDSLGSACAGEPESADVVLSMFQALRSLKVTSLCIDHVNKNSELFGSVYKFNASRVIFEVRKSQQPDDDRIVFAMFHRKSNNSKLIKDMGFELVFEDDKAIFSRKDVQDTPLVEHMRVADQIAALLRRGAMTVPDIADELQKSEGHVRKVFSDNPRMFVRLPDNSGKYANALHEGTAGSLMPEGGWL